MTRWVQVLVFAGVAWAASVQIRDLDGHLLSLFKQGGRAGVLFFIASDCPISNSYAPEIQRICRDYGTKGVSCSLLYEDVEINGAAAHKHLDEFRYSGIPAAIDDKRKIATQARATVTPEAVVLDGKGEIRYRGRIDNFYAALGKSRQQVTEHNVTDALDAVLAGKPVAIPETHALGCSIAPADLLKGKN